MQRVVRVTHGWKRTFINFSRLLVSKACFMLCSCFDSKIRLAMWMHSDNNNSSSLKYASNSKNMFLFRSRLVVLDPIPQFKEKLSFCRCFGTVSREILCLWLQCFLRWKWVESCKAFETKHHILRHEKFI